MIKKILNVFRMLSGLIFGKKHDTIKPNKPIVVSVKIVERNGLKFKITKYKNGETKTEPYNEEDPSNIDDFIDDINK